jgi:succinoglycan biosynthesis protein ExoW
MVATIAVIIPYFQRTPGILARTLAAMFARNRVEAFQVIIVDDASPAPAAAELSGLDAASRATIRLIAQPNAGPGAARNAGLAAVPEGVEYIAFLDSDDLWTPEHLARGMTAMRLGHDLYFSNSRREGADQSAFELLAITPEQHFPLDPANGFYQWRPDLFDACLRDSIIGLSTVVLRRAAFPGLRFAEDIGIADDIYFALTVARASSKIVFSFSEDAVYTVGENISVIPEWRSNKALRLVLSLSQCYHKILREYQITGPARRFIEDRIALTRVEFATIVISLLLHRQRVQFDYVRRFLRTDRALLAEFVKTAFRLIPRQLARLR